MRTPLLVAALLASVASCGTEHDDRVASAEYLTAAIFRPQCGTAACHSSATARLDLVLDTVDGLCDRELNSGPMVGFLTGDGGVDKNNNKVRMPFDSPLPSADIALIEGWEPDVPGCPP